MKKVIRGIVNLKTSLFILLSLLILTTLPLSSICASSLNCEVFINNGEQDTTSTLITLNIIPKGSQADKMMIANNAQFLGASWEAFKSPKQWTLTPGNGLKTIYAKVKDSSGKISSVCSDSIYLNQEPITRLAGDTRYETAVEICKSTWGSSDYVILARGDDFPDALAGAPLAVKYNAPILLTNPDELTSSTKYEILRLCAQKIIVLGSDDSIKDEVISEIENQCGISPENVIRIGGETRYETSALIASNLGKPKNNTAIIAYGENFPDSLAIASLAAAGGMPILLANKDTIPDATINQLKNMGITKTIIVGGDDVVSQGIYDWLASEGYDPERFCGETRYETVKAVAEYALANGIGLNIIYVAYGENFPDALSAGPIAAKNRSPVLLVRTTFIPDSIKSFINSHRQYINYAYILGGPDVISDEIKDELACQNKIELHASPESDGVHLFWSPTSLENFKCYNLIRSCDDLGSSQASNKMTPASKTQENNIIATITNQDNTSYVDTSAEKGNIYYYRVIAEDKNGNQIFSNVVEVEADNHTPPPEPVTLSAAAQIDGVHLSWTQSKDDDFRYYKIVRSSTNPEPTYEQDGKIAYFNERTQTSFIDTGTIKGTKYYYRICVMDSIGNTSHSNVVDAIAINENEPPKAVILDYYTESDGIHLYWTKNEDSDFKCYKVVRSETNPNPKYPDDGYLDNLSRYETSYIDSTAEAGHTYYYNVCVVDNGDLVTQSNTITVNR